VAVPFIWFLIMTSQGAPGFGCFSFFIDSSNHYCLLKPNQGMTSIKGMGPDLSYHAHNQAKQRRNTPQRRVILEELQASHSHPTAAELFALVRQKLPRISLGTVYRNLEVLCEDGHINKLELAGVETRFDAITQPHLHIRCTRCHKVEDLPDSGLMARPPAEMAGYLVEGSRQEFYGICPACRQHSSN
jgi:Fur family ferric uptake transcriptional regulator